MGVWSRSLGIIVSAPLVALGSAAVVLSAAVVRAQGEWSAPADAKALKNPVNGVGNGRKWFEINCVSCHGSGGKGDGPAVGALPIKPADWTSPKGQDQSDGELFWKISNGRGVMPSWKHLPEKQRWEIVNYLRQLNK